MTAPCMFCGNTCRVPVEADDASGANRKGVGVCDECTSGLTQLLLKKLEETPNG